ncbi:HAD family hydrolase [bacterium]|nr:HAD family hydrolase [bacterium]
MLKAICFDLGSTLWDDYPSELHHWEHVAAALQELGHDVSLEQIIAESEKVIETYCPSLTRSIIWRLCGGRREHYDAVLKRTVPLVLERLRDKQEFLRLNPLFPGVHDLLEELSQHYLLAVISQNFVEAQLWLEFHDLDGYFLLVSISARESLYKPDTRLFVNTCTALGVEPASAMMVGDRLDNDIWPANRIGMQTVRVLADPYRLQQPRYHNDVPGATIEAVAQLREVLKENSACGTFTR